MELYDQAEHRRFRASTLADAAFRDLGQSEANATARATLGLRALFDSIRAIAHRARVRHGEVDERAYEDKLEADSEVTEPRSARVSWESGATMPLLGGRYRYVSIIGAGSSADVIRAEDTFRPGRVVAIKVVNFDCAALAVREVRCMRFLASVSGSDSRPVVRLQDVLMFRGRHCLVMGLLETTLRPFILRKRWRAGAGQELPLRGHCARGRTDGRGFLERHGSEAMQGRRFQASANSGASMPPSENADTSRDALKRSGPSGACPVSFIRHVAFQLVGALSLLHEHGLVHTDVRPENVLVGVSGDDFGADGGPVGNLDDVMRGCAGFEVDGRRTPARLVVKLCDFGSAMHRSEAFRHYQNFDVQTLSYRAPEVLMGCPFGPAIDTWSVGVILLELLIGRPLFHEPGSRTDLLRQIVCALGPLPLRRFRVGRYYSEYFGQNQFFKEDCSGSSESRARMGCCSCCWIGDARAGLGQDEDHLCQGRCALSCARQSRAATSPVGVVGNVPLMRTHAMASSQPGAPDTRAATSTMRPAPERSSWQIGYAHICRLMSVADDATPPHGHLSSSAARRHPELLSLLAGMLCFDPDQRLTPLQALAHPFFFELLPFSIPIQGALRREVTKIDAPKPRADDGRLPRSESTDRLGKISTPPVPGNGRMSQNGIVGSREKSSADVERSLRVSSRPSTPLEETRRSPALNSSRLLRAVSQLPAPKPGSWATVQPIASRFDGLTEAAEVLENEGGGRGRVQKSFNNARVIDRPPASSDSGQVASSAQAPPADTAAFRTQANSEATRARELPPQATGSTKPSATEPAAGTASECRGCVDLSVRRSTNRFLTPATLAKLHSNLQGTVGRITKRAPHEVRQPTAPEPSLASTPQNQAVVRPSWDTSRALRKAAKSVATRTQTESVTLQGERNATRAGRKRQRETNLGLSLTPRKTGRSNRDGGSGEDRTPRRAAVAADAALARLRRDDGSDCDVE